MARVRVDSLTIFMLISFPGACPPAFLKDFHVTTVPWRVSGPKSIPWRVSVQNFIPWRVSVQIP